MGGSWTSGTLVPPVRSLSVPHLILHFYCSQSGDPGTPYMATQGSIGEEDASRPEECHFWSPSVIASKPSPDSRGEDIVQELHVLTMRRRLIWGHLGRFGVPTERVPACAHPVLSEYLKKIPAKASQLTRSQLACPSCYARPPVASYETPFQVGLMQKKVIYVFRCLITEKVGHHKMPSRIDLTRQIPYDSIFMRN